MLKMHVLTLCKWEHLLFDLSELYYWETNIYTKMECLQIKWTQHHFRGEGKLKS